MNGNACNAREGKFTKLDITYFLIISRIRKNIETPPSGILVSMLQGIFQYSHLEFRGIVCWELEFNDNAIKEPTW